MRLPLVTGQQSGLSPAISAQQYLNGYPEPGGDFSREAYILRPGLSAFASGVGSGDVRGGHYVQSVGYYVRGSKLYKVDGSTVTELGTLDTYSGRVYFADNGVDIGDQLMLVDGTSGYIYNISTGSFNKITDADFPANPTQVVYSHFLFAVNESGTQKWYVSASLDGTSWAALDFASAEQDSDDLIAMKALRNDIVLLGKRSVEIWTYSGNVDFEFEPFQNGYVDSGCLSAGSVVSLDNSLVWLENRNNGGLRFVRLEGQFTRPVSPNWLNERLEEMSNPADVHSWSMVYRGHEWAVFQFPTDNETWVLDASTGYTWHRWTHLDDGNSDRFLIDAHYAINGVHYGVSRKDGAVLKFDTEKYSDNGDEIEWEWIGPYLQNEGKRVFHRALQAQMEEGVGELSGVTDPVIELSWSDDDGHTWSDPREIPMGKIGKYGTRAKTRRLGQSYSRIYKMRCTDSVRRVLTAVEVDVASE